MNAYIYQMFKEYTTKQQFSQKTAGPDSKYCYNHVLKGS